MCFLQATTSFLSKLFFTFQNEKWRNKTFPIKGYSDGFEILINMVNLLKSDWSQIIGSNFCFAYSL